MSLRKQIEFIDELYQRPVNLLTEKHIESIIERAEEAGIREADVVRTAIDQFFLEPYKIETIEIPETARRIKVVDFIFDRMYKVLGAAFFVMFIITYIGFGKAAIVYFSTHEEAEIDRNYKEYREMVSRKSNIETVEYVEDLPGQAEE